MDRRPGEREPSHHADPTRPHGRCCNDRPRPGHCGVRRREVDNRDSVPAFEQLKSYTTEQVVWRDAQTGQELTRSSQFPKMTQGILVTPGYAGLQYFLTAAGNIIGLQVAPA